MRASMSDTSSDLLERWRHQIADRQSKNNQRRPRLAALGYLATGPMRDTLVRIDHLILVVLRADQPELGLRMAGYTARRVEWGIDWGGPECNRFAKDLALEPCPGARGWRPDLARTELLQLGLQLEHELDRHARIRQLPVRRRVELPRLWAGFRSTEARDLNGDGPEFDVDCRQARKAPRELFADTCRSHQGLALYPLDWVSHCWEHTGAVFADLDRFPKRQVIRVSDPENDLAGYRGAAHFDLHECRFMRRQDRQLIAA